MAELFLKVTLGLIGVAVAIVALLVAAVLVLCVPLCVTLLLQALGVIRRVPFAYNFRNLAVRWLTTILMLVTFTMVVALVVGMLAFVNGMYHLTANSGVAENVLVLSDGATDEVFSNLGYGDITKIELEPGVARDAEGRALASWEVYVLVNQPIPNAEQGSRRRRFLQVRGLEDPARSGAVHKLEPFPSGTWFSEAGVQTSPDIPGSVIQAVLGEGIARELGRDQGKRSLQVGDLFDLGPRKWIVAGILQSAGSTFDSEIWAKRPLVGEMFGKSSYSSVVLRADGDGESARELAIRLNATFKTPAVKATTEPDYFSTLNGTNHQFLGAIVFVAVFLAVGGVFGVLITMFAAISQRTKDIAVLRILGYARWQLLTSFFLEALLVAVIGGLLGCALGALADDWSLASVVGSGQGGGRSVVVKVVVSWRVLAAGIGLALVMGCVGGLVPALAAMRLRPLESVR